MTFHANYAAALCLKQKTAQEILHIYYADGDIPATVNESFLFPVSGEDVAITTDLFLAEPQLIFAVKDDNSIGASLRLYGTLTFSKAGLPTMTSLVSINAKVFCPVEMKEVEDGYQFSIKIPNGTIDQFGVTILNGNNPKNTFGIDLASQQVIASLEFALILQPDRTFNLTHPVLSQIKKTGISVSKVDVKTLEGTVVIGVDLQNLTNGNFGLLTDFNAVSTEKGMYKIYSMFLDPADDENGFPVYDIGWMPTKHKSPGAHPDAIGVSINAVVVNKVFTEYGRFEIMKKFEESKAKAIQDAIDWGQEHNEPPKYPSIKSITINNINIQLQDDYILVNANVTREAGTDITVDVHAKMRIISTDVDGDTPFVSGNQHLVGFRGEVFEVDIDQPDWLIALQVIGFIIGIALIAVNPFIGLFVTFAMAVLVAAVIPGIIESVENTTMLQLNKQLGKQQGAVTITLPGTEGPECSVTMSDFVAYPDGINGWFKFKVKNNEVAAILVDKRTDYFWAATDTSAIPVSLKLPKGFYHPEDPLVRVRWEVYAGNSLLYTKDNAIKTNNSFIKPLRTSIDHNKQEWQAFESFTVKCRVYRPWGDWTEEIYKSQINIAIQDRLHRDKKYVKWGAHQVFWKDYTAKKNDPARQPTGWGSENRTSKIHKTDADTRCKFVTHYSEDYDIDTLKYFDDLPFDADKIKENRQLVCDYCFFGGPDKKEPKPEA